MLSGELSEPACMHTQALRVHITALFGRRALQILALRMLTAAQVKCQACEQDMTRNLCRA